MISAPAGNVWVLADDRAGNVNQCLGVAEALKRPYEIKRLRYNNLARLPNRLLGHSIRHLTDTAATSLAPPWPDVVIGAGRRAVPVARHIKSQNRGGSFLVQCMWPGPPVDDLDLIAAPAHDQLDSRDNLMTTVGAPNQVNQETLSTAARAWADRLDDLPRPRTALLVGGDTKRYPLTANAAGTLGRSVSGSVSARGGTLMVTTSRRTTAPARDALYAALPDNVVRFDWNPEADNPYLAFLATADTVIVTGDSASMCTEACGTGHPVYIFAPAETTAPKHKRLHQLLYKTGYARPLMTGDEATELESWSYTPLNDAAMIAAEVDRRLSH